MNFFMSLITFYLIIEIMTYSVKWSHLFVQFITKQVKQQSKKSLFENFIEFFHIVLTVHDTRNYWLFNVVCR
jgi:hypothetical protein